MDNKGLIRMKNGIKNWNSKKMTEIIIKGKFVVEGISAFDNVRFPLKLLKLKIFPMQPYRIEQFLSYEEGGEDV